MELIVSRRLHLPETAEELQDGFYFSLWQKRQWPFDSLRNGDTLYLYESLSQRFVWKATARNVQAIEYESLEHVYDWLRKHYGEFDEEQSYLEKPKRHGYCLAFQCDPIEFLDKPKPRHLRLPILGWVRDQQFLRDCGLQ
jgi:hypothetical protein